MQDLKNNFNWKLEDTIVARATAHGYAGVAIVRVSGSLVKKIIEYHKAKLDAKRIQHIQFLDKKGNIIDKGILLFFESPKSFTGEDVLEFHCHGNPFIVDLIIDVYQDLGCRLAQPGEFTKRAFLNSKIDLSQAESIADLVHAGSKQAALDASQILSGKLSKSVEKISKSVLSVRVDVEAHLDFGHEDINVETFESIIDKKNLIKKDLSFLRSKMLKGNLIRNGIKIVLIGPTNAGKSKLFNALSDEDLAIVSETAGTTRDIVRNNIVIKGIPINLADTAGLRSTIDEIEQIGQKKARRFLDSADVVLCVIDSLNIRSSLELINAVESELSNSNKTIIYVYNKIDLLSDKGIIPSNCLQVSALTGEGLEDLRNKLVVIDNDVNLEESGFLARNRHIEAINKALSYLDGYDDSMPLECLAQDLLDVNRALRDIVGDNCTEKILGEIFSEFCIGK